MVKLNDRFNIDMIRTLSLVVVRMGIHLMALSHMLLLDIPVDRRTFRQ